MSGSGVISMEFPVYFHIFGRSIHPHLVFELLAYPCGFQLYLWLRRRQRDARRSLPPDTAVWLLVGAILGAAAGAKMLAWLESAQHYWAHRGQLAAWIGGKTIVGGLLGGWAGVEFAKWKLRIRQSTGDIYVFPLILGICIGRVGCFLTGLSDKTYGVKTSLPFAVDFGDGLRHPTQLYEIGFLIILGLTLLLFQLVRPRRSGELFRLFMLGYLLFRFVVEFIKPRETLVLDLSAIQLTCLAAAVWTTISWITLSRKEYSKPPDTPIRLEHNSC